MPKIPSKIIKQMAKRPGYQQEVASAGMFLRNGLKLTTKTVKGLVAKKLKSDKEADEWSLFLSIFDVIADHNYPDHSFNFYAPTDMDGLEHLIDTLPPYTGTSCIFWRKLASKDWVVHILHPRNEEALHLMPPMFECKPGPTDDLYIFTADLKEWAAHVYAGTEGPVYDYIGGLLGL
jgi:hypothetical protein